MPNQMVSRWARRLLYAISIGVLMLGMWTVTWAQDSPATSTGSGAGNAGSSNDDAAAARPAPDPAAYDNKAAQKFYERVFRRLQRMELPGDAPVSDTDTFVIGTACVHPATQHADLCFKTVVGVDPTARAITNFLGETADRGEAPYWHVFNRVLAEEDAHEILASLQKQYDEALAYREQLMQQYRARTIRRC